MLCIVPHLQLELGHPPLEFHELHVEARLLLLEARDLLLNARVLAFLPRVVPLHLVLDLLQLVAQCPPHLPCLRVKHSFQRLLLRTKHLHLSLVEVQLTAQNFHHVVQCQKFRSHIRIRVGDTH